MIIWQALFSLRSAHLLQFDEFFCFFGRLEIFTKTFRIISFNCLLRNLIIQKYFREILDVAIPPLMERDDFDRIYFQEDGAPIHREL